MPDHRFVSLTSQLLASPQAIWAELLTGQSWFASGCSGYARPESSLNDVQIIDEQRLAVPVQLVDASSVSLVANVPLLTPAVGRYWLSDGSLPLHKLVSPESLDREPLFQEYRPRPFASANVALADVRAAVVACLQVEARRLHCFAELLRTTAWRQALLRINCFDLLAHLLGADFLQAANLNVFDEISEFICLLDRMLESWLAEFCDASIHIFSPFSHTDCTARVNLNQLLALGQFCRLDGSAAPPENEILTRRRLAAALVNSDLVGKSDSQAHAVSSNNFICERTLAASPVAGAIYVNSKDRFRDGIVEAVDREEVIAQVHAYLLASLTELVGKQPAIWINSCANLQAPDLFVAIAGVDFYNSADGKVCDMKSKPRSVHGNGGFLWLPANEDVDGELNLVDVHKVLRHAARASADG